jgi:hypothetical protein
VAGLHKRAKGVIAVKRILFVIAIGGAIVCNHSFAQDDKLAEIRDLYPESVKAEAFSLDQQQAIRIDAVGAGSGKYEMVVSAWILNADSREVVWEMHEAQSSRTTRRLREFHDELTLPQGNYEVYYAFFPYWHGDGWRDFGNAVNHFWDALFDSDDRRAYRAEQDKLEIVIHGKGERRGEAGVERFQNAYKEEAFIAMTALWDDEYLKRGFTLDRPMEIQIYAIGEARHDEAYDYGWIIDTKTREKVWTFNYRDSEPAGGAEKNRFVNDVISLPAGSYVAFFATDDSHSHRRWNAPPPYDPAFWGMTIRATNPQMKPYVKTFEYEEAPEKHVIVQFTRLGDDEFRSQGFTLKKPMRLRFYAIGEGRDGEMFDYGWIVDTKTHEKIWKMDYEDTEHAGGGSKNRLVDKTVALDKGSYLVYFTTDDSHSYLDWNTSPPFDRAHWGLTITAVDENFNPADVTDYEEKEDQSILVKLVRMRDDERQYENFSLAKDARVRVYAIGEGSAGEMHDYGWIEDKNTRKVVWEMSYRLTDHAGGARKNRVFNDTIYLKAGEYTVYYETDDSHAFNDWNSDPPHDPVNWGITVFAAKDE